MFLVRSVVLVGFHIALTVATPAGAQVDAFQSDDVQAAANPAPAHPELRPVLDQFGGLEGLHALMDDFMAALIADPRTAGFFENIEHERVKRQLAEQFCVILGGDCVYTGRDMVESHVGLAIDRADFNALVEVLQITMQRRGIPFRAQNKLLAKLAPMHREIIER